MKRDFDLIRAILFDVQAAPPLESIEEFKHAGKSQEEVCAHISLLIEAGLVGGEVTLYHGDPPSAIIHRLTWRGHDFLEAMSDDSLWTRAKQSVLLPAGGVMFDVLLDWLKYHAKEKLGLPN